MIRISKTIINQRRKKKKMKKKSIKKNPQKKGKPMKTEKFFKIIMQKYSKRKKHRKLMQ